ncbi:MAG: hypothetical protein GY765_25790 [bacterium]|nr:hypothetical protein [bacterium]
MIRLGNRPPVPPTLDSPKVRDTKARIAHKTKSGEELWTEDFPSHWRAEDIKKTLYDFHHGKCCFCERKRDRKRDSDVEHFRPKGGVSDEPGHPGYWWLTYDWNNYFYACKSCNQEYKKNLFPLLPDGKRAFSEADDLNREHPMMVHPIDDDPERLIGFDWSALEGQVKAVGKDEAGRGFETANQLTAINMTEVIEERGELLRALELSVKEIKSLLPYADAANDETVKNYCLKIIASETAPGRTFAGFRRAFFRAAGLGGFLHTAG